MIDLCLLGTGGTMPMPGRRLSSLLVRVDGGLLLFDCGEGTQVALREIGWGFRAIGHVFVSHFHADHVGGLPGLLLTIGNSGRGEDEPVTIWGPPGLTQIVDGLRVIAPYLPFPVVCRELFGRPPPAEPVGPMTMRCQWGDHDLPCLAYRLDLPRGREFDPARARALGLPVPAWKVLQHGGTVEHGGRTVSPDEVLGPPRPGLSLAFVTDTRPTPELAEFLRGADLLVCEAAYGDPADAGTAAENKHMTFAEAAGLARDAAVRRLWLTHFSPAMPDPSPWRAQATAVFPETTLGTELMTGMLKFGE